MRFCAMAFSSVVLTCSWQMTSANDCGRYLRAITWYMGWAYARPRVIRGTRPNHYRCFLPDLAGFAAGALHGARDLTSIHRSMAPPKTRSVERRTIEALMPTIL